MKLVLNVSSKAQYSINRFTHGIYNVLANFNSSNHINGFLDNYSNIIPPRMIHWFPLSSMPQDGDQTLQYLEPFCHHQSHQVHTYAMQEF